MLKQITKKLKLLNRRNLLVCSSNLNTNRNVHLTTRLCDKIHIDRENNHAFSVLNKFVSKNNVHKLAETKNFTLKDFNAILNQNYRQSNSKTIVETFLLVKDFCKQNNINLSDARFNNLVDGLMDHCQNLTYDDLYQLLNCLCEYPECERFFSHNFHDVWSCLDDVCCWKMQEWNIEQVFSIADIWYKLNLGKLGDFIFEVLDSKAKHAEKLTKSQLVHIFFYYNVSRRRNVHFEYEYALEKMIDKMTVDEMGVVSLGYFKTQSKIKIIKIMEIMLQKVRKEAKTIHEISLSAILKILRFSKPPKLSDDIASTLDTLVDEVDRLSNLCALHIALLGTGVLVFHKPALRKVAEKLVKDINNVEALRLKEIERLLMALTMFDFDPKTTPNIFEASLKELHSKERIAEIVKYSRCLPSALNYLSIRNIYSYELMSRILDRNFITEVYGKRSIDVPRELFVLNSSIDIECPEYKGNRLPLDLKYKSAKWLSEYAPSYDQYKKLSAADTYYLDVVDNVREIVGGKEFYHIGQVLPHFARSDIILCKNTKTKKFIEPKGFQNYTLGDVMFPHNDPNLKWYAVVVLGWNHTIKGKSLPLGTMVMKQRQLGKIGYSPVLVYWNEFMNLTPKNKRFYLENKIL